MEYKRIDVSRMDQLWEMQRAYKAAVREDAPSDRDRERLRSALGEGRILFYGAWDGGRLAGCCSVTIGFSTFNYRASGVFEDFYILPEYRHRGIARALIRFARRESGVGSLTVGCADCDTQMYKALGFSVQLGNMMAFDEDS